MLFGLSEFSFINHRKLPISWLLEVQFPKSIDLSIIEFSLINNVAAFKIVYAIAMEKTFFIITSLVNVVFGSEKIGNWKLFYPTVHLINVWTWAHFAAF